MALPALPQGRASGRQEKRGDMSKRKADYDGKADPYVKIIKAMLKEPAWLALSYGARCLYVLLKSYYNGENNGRVYVGVRRAAKELGAGRNSAERWFRELDNLGFIEPTQRAFLGIDGKGSATHWRLTEIGYMGEQPTRDYKRWQPPEKKSLTPKKGRTVPIVVTPRPQNEDTCPQNSDALAPAEAPDRPQNDGISTSPYVAAVRSFLPHHSKP
jgi:hypothetical protein